MRTAGYKFFRDGEMYIGWLEEFPDYWTQGVTLEELEENLRDIAAELTAGTLPQVVQRAELSLP